MYRQSVRQDAGFKGLACDLIEYDKAYEGIFKYLLGRVAVVDNMDTAVRLSKTAGGGIRFVTPDGEITSQRCDYRRKIQKCNRQSACPQDGDKHTGKRNKAPYPYI